MQLLFVITIALWLLPATAGAQTRIYTDTATDIGEARFRSGFFGPRYYLGDQRVDHRRFVTALAGTNAETAAWLQRARRRDRVGNLLEGLGAVTTLVGIYLVDPPSHRFEGLGTRNTVLLGGFLLSATGIGFQLSGASALRRGVRHYNASRLGTGWRLSTSSNGVGLAYRW